MAQPTTVTEYLKALAPERRSVLTAVRSTVKKNLPAGYVETVEFGMPSYVVPLSVEPKTYNGRPLIYAAIAAQKRDSAG